MIENDRFERFEVVIIAPTLDQADTEFADYINDDFAFELKSGRIKEEFFDNDGDSYYLATYEWIGRRVLDKVWGFSRSE